MKKIYLIITILMTITMVAGCGSATLNDNNTSSADRKLSEDVLVSATKDGSKSAYKLNEIKDDNQYEDTLKAVMNKYYKNDKPSNELDSFVAKIDSRGDEIVGNYASAYKERTNSDKLNYKTEEILVSTKKDVSKGEIKSIVEKTDGNCQEVVSLEDENVAIVKLSKEYTVENAGIQIEKDNRIENTQPNYIYKAAETTNVETKSIENPNDPSVSKQWSLASSKISGSEGAWNQMTNLTSSGYVPTVGVIDTGVDLTNEDLKSGNVTLVARYENGKSLTPTGDNDGHGTHVTGIIGATAENEKGITGITYNSAKIQVVDAEYGNAFSTIDMCMGIETLTKNGAEVINLSIGGYGYDEYLNQSMKNAYDKGVLIVTASGNEATSDIVYPSDSSYCIAVNASKKGTTESDISIFDSTYSNYGYDKDITAPGTDILSTLSRTTNKTGYGYATGTSMASPHVAAIAALIIKEANDSNKDLGTGKAKVRNIKNIIFNSPTNPPTSGFSQNTAFGVINAANAITAIKNATVQNVDSISLNRKTATTYIGNTVGLEYKVTPANTLNTSGTWTSSNTAVATVDSDGIVTGKKAGTSVITLKVGDKTATCTVTVKNNYTKASVKAWSTVGNISSSDYISSSVSVDPANNEYCRAYCDKYSFYGTKGTTVRICMQSSYIDSHLIILDSKGKCVKTNDNISKNEVNSYISYKIPTTGYYFVEAIGLPYPYVGAYWGNYKGPYRLSIMSSGRKVSGLKVKSRGYHSVKIGWTKLSTASNVRYRIYIYNSRKKYVGSKYVKTNYYKRTGLSRHKKLYFKVRPYLTTTKGKLYGSTSGYIKAVSK